MSTTVMYHNNSYCINDLNFFEANNIKIEGLTRKYRGIAIV